MEDILNKITEILTDFFVLVELYTMGDMLKTSQ